MFYWQSQVRNYEIDQQNIVNNAIYLNYLEEARGQFVEQSPLDLAAYEKLGYHFVIAKIAIEYKRSLFAKDKFKVSVRIAELTSNRIIFEQKIIKLANDKVVAQARVEAACMNIQTRRAEMPEKLLTDLAPVLDS